MNTKSKSIEIARQFVTLRDRGLSVHEACEFIASRSNCDADTVLVAIHYAIAG